MVEWFHALSTGQSMSDQRKTQNTESTRPFPVYAMRIRGWCPTPDSATAGERAFSPV